MKRTQIRILPSEFKLDIGSNIFTVGSCFSSEINKYLEREGVVSLCNPFGTIYNTYSIYKTLDIIKKGDRFSESNIYFENSIFFSPYHSTEFDGKDKIQTLKKINETIESCNKKIINSNLFIITLGTSVVYRYIQNDEIVANCHKLPGNLFKKDIIGVDENVLYLKEIIELIKGINSKNKIIFTLSPVRHNPDNLVENQYSKSILRIAIERVVNNTDIIYFPSYEIVMDELRDYMYYKNDRVHINNKGVNIIMKRFKDNYFSEILKEYTFKYSRIKKSINHKPRNPFSPEYYNLLKKMFKDIYELSKVSNSLLIEKYQVIIVYRMIKYSLINNDDINFISGYCVGENLLNFLNIWLDIERDNNREKPLINYSNEYIKNLHKIIDKIMLKYYILINDTENIRKIIK